MDNSLLEEQVERIRRLTEQLDLVTSRASEMSNETARDRDQTDDDRHHKGRDSRPELKDQPKPRAAPPSRRRRR